MGKLIVPAAIAAFLLFSPSAPAAVRGKWVEVRSPNFIVVSNAGEGSARKVAAQFEQIRALFRDSLPYVKANPSPIVTIFAVKDEDSLRELLPEYWAEKEHAHPAGIFINRGDQYQVAVNVTAHGDNPYETVYHEYYHSVTMPYFPGLPTWVSEGLADFYGNSRIEPKTASLGLPNADLIEELRSKPLIPLNVLFKVDHSSPYYNEQNQVSIFYAESWALTHYLMLGDNRAHNPAFGVYLSALTQGATQDEAAAKAFGDLGKLQRDLQRYINNFAFPAMQTGAPAKLAEADLHARPLSDADVDAYSGGFLALHNRFTEAKPLLDEAAQLDPKLALAQRNLALMHYFRQERPEALASLSSAIALDPNDADTRYLRAELTFESTSLKTPQIGEDLRQAVALNPNLAPAFALLSAYLADNNENQSEAFNFAQKAVSLEPGNADFQLNFAQVLARMRRYDDAEKLARNAKANALDDGARSHADQVLTYIGQARDYDVRAQQRQEAARQASINSQSPRASAGSVPAAEDDGARPQLVRRGAGESAAGVVAQVRCTGDEMQVTLKVDAGPAPLLFHAKDRNRVGYSSDVRAVRGDIEPCTELKGHTANIVYRPSDSKSFQGELVHVEVTK